MSSSHWSEITAAIYNAPLIQSQNIPVHIVKIIVMDTFNWSWDPFMSFGIDLTESNCHISHYKDRTVRAPNGWQTTRGTLCLDGEYIYEWDIIAIDFQQDYGDIIVGVLSDDGIKPKQQERNNDSFVDKCESWSLHSSNDGVKSGHKNHTDSSRNFGGGNFGEVEYGTGFRKGDTVKTIYNSKMKTLSFKVNGIDQGIAYENVKGNIYPFITVYDGNAKAKLMSLKFSAH
eukprot:486121_1